MPREIRAGDIKRHKAGTLSDGRCPGLRLVASPGPRGVHRSWIYRYRTRDGKLRQVKLGTHSPTFGLAEARAAWAVQKSIRDDPARGDPRAASIDAAAGSAADNIRVQRAAPRRPSLTQRRLVDPGYPRDMIGYGARVPQADWPDGARIALQFVLNYEEGAEYAVLHGDAASETFLSDIIGALPYKGARHMSMESLYEYGSRAGVWRVLRVFEQRRLPLTVFAVGMALARNPEVAAACVAARHEVASHGWRWINYHGVPEAVERAHIRRAVESITQLTGVAPVGWYTGRDNVNTRRLVVEHGGFLYDSDSYSDDLPYWQLVGQKPHLTIPYTLDTNDMRFATAQGFHTGEQFFQYLKDAFDVLYAEGAHSPKMLSVGLHCRLIGRPARIAGLTRFLDYVQKHQRVWICRRADIARHWIARHPYRPDRA